MTDQTNDADKTGDAGGTIEKKSAPPVATGKQSMTAEKAKALGLDPSVYGKPAKKK